MACSHDTQARPEFQYRFLALNVFGRNVIHITATTERAAREKSPAGCVLVFAARLPAQEVTLTPCNAINGLDSWVTSSSADEVFHD